MTDKRLDLAKITVVRKLPLLAPLVSKLKFIEDNNIKTIGVSFRKKIIAYNKEFVDSLDNKKLCGVIAHEFMHYVLYHDAESVKSESYLAVLNMSTDAVINYILINKLDFELTEDAVTFSTLRKISKTLRKIDYDKLVKMSHIDIARELLKDVKDFANDLSKALSDYVKSYNSDSNMNNDTYIDSDSNKVDNNDECNNSNKDIDKELENKIKDVVDKHFSDSLSENERKAIVESIKESLRRERLSEKEAKELRKEIEKGLILQKELEKNRGTDIANITNIIELLIKKKKRNWRRLLRDTFSEIRNIAKDYDFTRASRKVEILKKYYNINTFIPSLKKESDKIKVVVGIDVSGSISDKEYIEFVREVYSLSRDLNIEGYIVMWEAEVTKVIEMKNGWNKKVFDELKERRGYGGTIIKSFFDKATELVKNRKKNTYLIIMTDGETEEVEKEWVKGWKKVVILTHSKANMKNIENLSNVEIEFLDESI